MGGGSSFRLEFKHLPCSRSFGHLVLESARGDAVYPLTYDDDTCPNEIVFHYVKLSDPCPTFQDDPGLYGGALEGKDFSLLLILGRFISSAAAGDWGEPEESFIMKMMNLDKLQLTQRSGE